MTRSKPTFRPKKTGSCPCVQDAKDKDLKEIMEKLAQQEPRFSLNDIYHPSDEFIDLESYSYSEVSSFGFPNETIFEGQSVESVGETFGVVGTGLGDQIEAETYTNSGENVSSGQPEDSEPNENSETFEDRKLNIAATVMSWLDNYGQARGYSQTSQTGKCGTSILINPDDVSRIDSGSILDIDEAVSTKSQCQSRTGTDYIAGPDALKQQFTLLETSCSILVSFYHDLEPLVKTKQEQNQDQYPDQSHSNFNWRKVQEVFCTWANLMSTIWKRSREGNITRGELFSFTRLCENLDVLATEVTPVDISKFINPVVRMSLSRTQGFINLASKWAKEIVVTGKLEDIQEGGISSWNELMKTVTMVVNEQLKLITISYAKSILENKSKYDMYPKYEIILHDVTPSKTVTGWMFFGKVELRHVENGDEVSKQISVQARDSGLRLTFMASIPRMTPCIDYGSIFHIVNRACLECCQYYDEAQREILQAKEFLNKKQPLISPSYAKKFEKFTKLKQYHIMSHIISQIIADHTMDPTIKAIDEILRSFDALIVTIVNVFRKFIKRTKYEEQQDVTVTAVTSGPNLNNCEAFSEISVPMTTDANTMLFQTVRRFLALRPMTAENTNGTLDAQGDGSKNKILQNIDESDSSLIRVHTCLENCIRSLYYTSSKNVFPFHLAIQSLYAISHLTAESEEMKKAVLEKSMKNLVLHRLGRLKRINKDTRASFRLIVAKIDKQMKIAEVAIDKIMAKGTALGITIPARTSGVRFSHRHDKSILIRYNRNSYIRNQAKRLRQSNEVSRHTRKYVVEPDIEDDCGRNSISSLASSTYETSSIVT